MVNNIAGLQQAEKVELKYSANGSFNNFGMIQSRIEPSMLRRNSLMLILITSGEMINGCIIQNDCK
jgi:hypothetical protein